MHAFVCAKYASETDKSVRFVDIQGSKWFTTQA